MGREARYLAIIINHDLACVVETPERTTQKLIRRTTVVSQSIRLGNVHDLERSRGQRMT